MALFSAEQLQQLDTLLSSKFDSRFDRIETRLENIENRLNIVQEYMAGAYIFRHQETMQNIEVQKTQEYADDTELDNLLRAFGAREFGYFVPPGSKIIVNPLAYTDQDPE